MAKKASKQSARRQSGSGLDIAVCRAMRFDHDDEMVYCLLENVRNCDFALRFGSGFFCHHPKRGEIVARTKAQADA